MISYVIADQPGFRKHRPNESSGSVFRCPSILYLPDRMDDKERDLCIKWLAIR